MSLLLQDRTGLPDALQVLVRDYPRDGWAADPHFHGLVSFRLDRHMMFRNLMAHMLQEAEGFLDAERDAQGYAQGLSRYGGLFVSNLHGHHQIEDHHYFPLLRQKDARIEAGFDLLDADHHALDGLLNSFVEAANSAIRGIGGPDPRPSVDGFRAELLGLQRLIDRHLTDEEDLIVPVILKYGADDLPG